MEVARVAEAWVMLVYRVPREPSTPRIAIWRKLRKYGVFQLTDGVVLLPASPRTQEQLEWVAEDVVSAGGHAEVWTAAPTSLAEFERIRDELQSARGEEYGQIVDAAGSALGEPDPDKALKTLRRRLREVTRRDHFPTDSRDRADQAVRSLADTLAASPARQS
ncbi:Chromate resistance protein ChrB [Gordonia sp. IITR100]|uniref:Chromate resistance protein ChrB n=1 Tax=Gordonia sp. IITR100 TaxID=1314686 RepID=UPI0020CA7C87|nr:Chromate resistance protein ChrB [Gordonia sp. IITR100]